MTVIRSAIRSAVRGAVRSALEDRFGGLPPLPDWVTTGNLFSNPTSIDNAAWTKSGILSTTANAISGPYNGSFGDLLTESTGAGTHQALQSITYDASTTYIQRMVVKGNGRDLTMFFSSTTHGSNQQAYFNLTTGAITTAAGSPNPVATSLGNGWWLFSIQATTTALGAPTAANTSIRLAQYPATQSYTGDGASGVYVAAAGIHVV